MCCFKITAMSPLRIGMPGLKVSPGNPEMIPSFVALLIYPEAKLLVRNIGEYSIAFFSR